MINYKEHIVINPSIRFGKPCIIDTRISVYDILSWLANGVNESEIIQDYPELTNIHIKACLAYAADREHKTRVA